MLISPWRGIGLRSVHYLCSNSLKAETHNPTNVGRQCRLPDTRTIDGRHLIRSFMLLTVILIIISFPSPTLSFIPDSKTSLFCKSFPLQPFFFFSRTDYIDSPDCLLLLLSFSYRIVSYRFGLYWPSCRHPKTPSSLASFKSRLVLPFWYRLSWKRGR